jgi:hypothetical protein
VGGDPAVEVDALGPDLVAHLQETVVSIMTYASV